MSDKQNAWHKRRNDAIRAELFVLLGGVCVRCGFDDARALQIDHVHGGGSRETKHLNQVSRAALVKANPERYQILCANCNWIKRREREDERGGRPRGSVGAGKVHVRRRWVQLQQTA